MTTQELRELDAWIDLHLFGQATKYPLRYTTDKACALDVLKKCAEKYDCHSIRFADKWYVGARNIVAADESLETAICLLAKQLFSKTTK